MKCILSCPPSSTAHLGKACHTECTPFRLSRRLFSVEFRKLISYNKQHRQRSFKRSSLNASLYSVLKLDKHASKDDIRKAYRRLARKYHPDTDNSPEAQRSLKTLIAAYKVLSDDLERKRYDDLHSDGPQPQQSNNGHRGSDPGEDVVVIVSLDFLEAALGKQHALEVSVKRTCPECVGLGAAPGTHPVFCSLCRGRGHVRTRQTAQAGEPLLTSSVACPACGASGIVRQEWCSRCGGDGLAQTRVAVNVSIPAGVDGESVLRVKGQGDAGRNEGAAGDLYITFAIKPRAGIMRSGLDLYSEVIVRYTDAILGGTAAVTTIHGQAQLSIPAGTQHGQVLTLPGAGISSAAAALAAAGEPRQLGAGRSQRGAHHYTVVLLLPSLVNDEERSALQRLRQLSLLRRNRGDPGVPCQSAHAAL